MSSCWVFDSQLLTPCAIIVGVFPSLSLSLFLSSVCLLVVMRRGGPQLDVKAHYEVNASGCEAQLRGSETEPFVFKLSAAKPGIIISSPMPPQPRPHLSSSSRRRLASQLINLQILFSIKCLQKDNCDFINSFLGSRWCSAGLPC